MRLKLFETLPNTEGVLPSEVGKQGPWIGVIFDNGYVYGFWKKQSEDWESYPDIYFDEARRHAEPCDRSL